MQYDVATVYYGSIERDKLLSRLLAMLVKLCTTKFKGETLAEL